MRGKASAPANGDGRAASKGKPTLKVVGVPNTTAITNRKTSFASIDQTTNNGPNSTPRAWGG
jgi:hypothetical protein